MENNKLVLIDGNSYLHRAYHALPKLTDERGNVVNAVFGFMKMLKKIIDIEKPTHIFVAFDHGKKTFRHRRFNEYKANRQATDQDLKDQFPILFDMLRALRVRFASCEGYEADDIIASFSSKAQESGTEVAIVTTDKDLYQLVNDSVYVIDGVKDMTYDAKGVQEKIGVTPGQVVDYLALIGDKSDNLPGVMGVGPVTARKLLSEYGNLDSIFDNVDRLKGSVGQKIRDNRENALMTRELVELRYDIQTGVSLEECAWKGPDAEALTGKLRALNFKSLETDWITTSSPPPVVRADMFETLPAMLSEIKKRKLMKTVSLEFYFSNSNKAGSGTPSALGISDGKFCAFADSRKNDAGETFIKEDILQLFIMLKDKGVMLAAYDTKGIYKLIRRLGFGREDFSFDVIAADYVLDPEKGGRPLGEVSMDFLGYTVDDVPDAALYSESAIQKSAERLTAVLSLEEKMTGEIKKSSSDKLFEKVEMPVLKILGEMELFGIKIDEEELNKVKKEFSGKIASIENDIYRSAGSEFNINSPKQLAEILFQKLRLKPARKTKAGYSTAEDVLHTLKKEHELPGYILAYRHLHKLMSTYIEPFPAMIDKKTGRLHTTFNITGTVTGRLSSTEPNLQNIPIRTEDGARIRKTFVPANGNIFLSVDYSQIDLRVLAHISGDNNLIESFRAGKDIHSITASRIFGVPENEVTSEMRKKAKAINFGIVYGMTSHGLASRVDMTVEESGEFIRKYFLEFPGIKRYMEKTVADARKNLYVCTILNRRRYVPQINSSNGRIRMVYERIAINTPIQGSSADIIKLAMVDLYKKYDFNRSDIKLLLQIHDELLFEMPEDMCRSAVGEIKNSMEGACGLSVPLAVDTAWGKNWRDLESC